ncbi:MAG: PQ-loop domain-containing transporter [Patescibacteria group bacterium]
MSEIFYYLPAVFFTISGLPQIYRLFKRKSSADISLTMYVLTVAGIAIVVYDAWRNGIMSIFFSNLISLVITSVSLFLVIYYRWFRKVNL